MLLSLIAPLLVLSSVDDTTSSVPDTNSRTSATVVVQADAFAGPCCGAGSSTGAHTIDELMQLGGVTLVQRAQMAGEATVRGLRGGQITTTIDGMKVHAACVDKMDPATAYVELDNLRTLELTQGAGDLRFGAQLGGSLNFISRMPTFGPLQGDVEAGYDLNGSTRRVRVDLNGSSGDLAARVGYVFRQSDDYVAGRDLTIDGSGLTKSNANAILQWRIDPASSITAHMIYDLATDIGYPALLMDTRRAEAIIGSVVWRQRWSSSLSTNARLYGNTVDHTMDDLDRPEAQVRSRTFMAGMRMPMDGTSTTVGLIADAMLTTSTSVLIGTLDAWMLDASATMRMLPLDPSVPTMTMTNIGDARVGNVGLSVSWEFPLRDDVMFRASGRIDVNAKTLRNIAAQSILQGYVGDTEMSPVRMASTVHASLQWRPTDELSLSIAVARAERLPTHLETFGFFLYDPQADIVTVGDPALRTEKAVNLDVRVDHTSDDLRLSGGVYVQSIDDHIAAPLWTPPLDDSLDLRLVRSVGTALLAGSDVSCSLTLSEVVSVGASASYTYAELTSTGEPLPLIQPLSMMLRAAVGDADLWSEVRVRGALAQPRASSTLLRENTTPSWATLDVSAGLRFAASWSVKAVLANILDTRYHEHTSIRDMPSRGRSLSFTLRYAW